MKTMYRKIRNAMAVIGATIIFIAAGTSDYHIIELGQEEPSFVPAMLALGCLMCAPIIGQAIYEEVKEMRK